MQLNLSRPAPLIDIERRTVMPGCGDLAFRCGKCGFAGFRAHVRPTSVNEARMSELVCAGCKTVYRFDPSGRLERGGNLEP